MSLPRTSLHLAEWLSGEHHGSERSWSGVATLREAGPDDVSFFTGNGHPQTDAGVLLTRAHIPGRTCITVDDPKLAFILLIEHVFPVEHVAFAHRSASVDASAFVHATATLHAGVVVMAGCTVGPRSVLYPNVVLYPNTVVGADCILHAGCVLGADGFGLHPTADGPVRVPHRGRVVLEDEVEVGANATIDRAFLGETRIGRGTTLDNLVHIGHNSRLGEGVVIAAQTGLSGSVIVEDGVVMGGQVGVVEHTRIGAAARVGAQSGVTRDVEAGTAVLGTPAEDAMLMKRLYVRRRQAVRQED